MTSRLATQNAEGENIVSEWLPRIHAKRDYIVVCAAIIFYIIGHIARLL
jgi:hypothetical protein